MAESYRPRRHCSCAATSKCGCRKWPHAGARTSRQARLRIVDCAARHRLRSVARSSIDGLACDVGSLRWLLPPSVAIGGRACGEVDQQRGDLMQGAIERDAITAAIVVADRVPLAIESAAVAVAEAERVAEVLDEGIKETVAEGLAAERRAQHPAFAERARDVDVQIADFDVLDEMLGDTVKREFGVARGQHRFDAPAVGRRCRWREGQAAGDNESIGVAVELPRRGAVAGDGTASGQRERQSCALQLFALCMAARKTGFSRVRGVIRSRPA